MKKLHKVIMGVTAIVMAFSMTAMTACVGGNGEGGNQNGGGGGIISDGGNEQGGGNDDDKKDDDNKDTRTDAIKTLDAFQKQSFNAIALEIISDTTNNSVYFDCDESGKILEGETEQKNHNNSVNTMSEKINLSTLDMDGIEHYVRVELDDDDKVVASSKEEGYSYDFTRGDYAFYTSSKTEITDFSKVTLGVSSVETNEQLNEILAQMPEDGTPANLLLPVSAILDLADIYEGASFADKKLTVNLNKVVYNIYNEVLKVIEDLKTTTTVGDVIGAAPVKNLISALTYGIDTKEVYDQVVELIGSAAPTAEGEEGMPSYSEVIGSVLASLPQPEEGESVYDYLVKLLDSGELKMLIANATGKVMTKPVSQLTYAEVLALMGMQAPSIDDIKDLVKGMIAQYATVTEDKVTISMEGDENEFSAAEIVFSVGDDYTVTSVSFSIDVVTTYESVFESGSSEVDGVVTKYYSKSEGTTKNTVSATIELSTEEYTLKNINNCKVEQDVYELQDQIAYTLCGRINNPDGEKSMYSVYVGLEIKGGKVIDGRAYYTDYVGGKNEYILIEDSSFDGEKVSFTIDGVATCQYSVEYTVSEYNGSMNINIYQGECSTIGENVVFELNSEFWSYVNAKHTVVETTVAGILAK